MKKMMRIAALAALVLVAVMAGCNKSNRMTPEEMQAKSEALVEAVKSNNVDEVRRLIAEGADPDTFTPQDDWKDVGETLAC